MKRIALLVGLALALTAGQASAVSSGRTSEATKVRAVLVNQMRLYNQARWRPMYRTFAPRVRSRCPYPRFVVEMKGIKALVGGPMAVRRVVVRVSGRRATATYQQLAGGKVFASVTANRPDKFVRIGDRWFDDLDYGSPCSDG
jgi:hypothetical protein